MAPPMTNYERDVSEAESVAAIKRDQGLTWNEAVEFLKKARPKGPGSYAKLGDIRSALGVCDEPEQSRHRLSPARQLSPEDEEIAAGVAATVMIGLRGDYSTPEMVKAAAGKPCPYCWYKMVRGPGLKHRASRDHLVARVSGGNLARGNVLIVCQACNCDKSHRSLSQWLKVLQAANDPRMAIVDALIRQLRAAGRGEEIGGVAERLMAPDPKPGSPSGLASSNLAPSANTE